MLVKMQGAISKHIKNNFNTLFFLLMAFVVGVSAGAFTVNGLNTIQRDELTNYFHGFLQLLDKQNVDSNALFQISLLDNARIVIIMWVLGVTIIGIPFIFLLVGIRGFITGFGTGFIIKTMGLKGVVFTVFTILPKELVIVPSIIALGVSGVNFSLNIIKSRSIKRISKENIKTNFIGYCGVTLLYSCFILVGILLEVYITPVFIRMLSPVISI